MSHQRVQQIVRIAGGSWWRLIWRTRIVRRDAVCTWCERPPGEVSKLVAGPNVYICDACMTAAERALEGRAGALEARRTGGSGRCDFCYRRRTVARAVVVGPRANVCADCLRVCREIADGRAA